MHGFLLEPVSVHLSVHLLPRLKFAVCFQLVALQGAMMVEEIHSKFLCDF